MASSRFSVKLTPVLKNRVVTTYSPSFLSLVAVIIFIVFAIHPTVKNIISLQQTINQQQKVLSDLKQKTKTLSDAVNNYNSIPEETRLKLINLLPNTANMTCLVNDINNRSASTKIIESGIQLQPAQLNGPTKCILDSSDLEAYRQRLPSNLNLKELGFSLNGQGPFSSLTDFLASFNNSTRLINLEGAIINKGGETGSLTIIINGKSYYYQ